MSDDNIQRKMDFIVEQQAKFFAEMGLLQEAQKRQSANIDKLTSDIDELKSVVDKLVSLFDGLTSVVDKLVSVVDRLASHVQAVTSNVQELTPRVHMAEIDIQTLGKLVRDGFNETRESFDRMQAQADADRVEMRESFSKVQAQADADRAEMRESINNLIIANEATRKLSEEVAHLASKTSQRVTSLEERP